MRLMIIPENLISLETIPVVNMFKPPSFYVSMLYSTQCSNKYSTKTEKEMDLCFGSYQTCMVIRDFAVRSYRALVTFSNLHLCIPISVVTH